MKENVLPSYQYRLQSWQRAVIRLRARLEAEIQDSYGHDGNITAAERKALVDLECWVVDRLDALVEESAALLMSGPVQMNKVVLHVKEEVGAKAAKAFPEGAKSSASLSLLLGRIDAAFSDLIEYEGGKRK